MMTALKGQRAIHFHRAYCQRRVEFIDICVLSIAFGQAEPLQLSAENTAPHLQNLHVLQYIPQFSEHKREAIFFHLVIAIVRHQTNKQKNKMSQMNLILLVSSEKIPGIVLALNKNDVENNNNNYELDAKCARHEDVLAHLRCSNQTSQHH